MKLSIKVFNCSNSPAN